MIVELDGQAAHPEGERWRDIRRDNVSAANGLITLRYSSTDVMERPCEMADQIARTLGGRGFTGSAQRCGPRCVSGDPAVQASTRGAAI